MIEKDFGAPSAFIDCYIERKPKFSESVGLKPRRNFQNDSYHSFVYSWCLHCGIDQIAIPASVHTQNFDQVHGVVLSVLRVTFAYSQYFQVLSKGVLLLSHSQ